MNRVTALLVVVAATALLAAGCGGSSPEPLSKADYVSQVKAIGKDLSTSLNGIGSPKDSKTAATALTSVQSDLRDAVKKLEDITPPDNVKTAHENLTKAVGEFADELDPIIDKLNDGKLSALGSVTTLKGLTDIQSAATAIGKAGYNIGN